MSQDAKKDKPKEPPKKLWALLLSKIDRKDRLIRAAAWFSEKTNRFPRIKKFAKWTFFAIGFGNAITQVVSWPMFATFVGRKNGALEADYIAAETCFEKMKRNETCTVAEVQSLKKAWDNDVWMCYSYGTGCLASRYLNAPKAK